MKEVGDVLPVRGRPPVPRGPRVFLMMFEGWREIVDGMARDVITAPSEMERNENRVVRTSELNGYIMMELQ